MRTAVIVGLNARQKKRLLSVFESLGSPHAEDWQIEFFTVDSDTPEIPLRLLPSLFSDLDTYPLPHVLSFSKQDGKVRQDVANRIRQHYRFRWLDNGLIATANAAPQVFLDRLKEILQEETEWGFNVQPKSESSPLLVPECCFDAAARVRAMWRAAQAYGDMENLRLAASLVVQFGDVHWRRSSGRGHYNAKYKWIDAGNIGFDIEGERHGVATCPRNRKFSYAIPPGFHFDLSHESGSGFSITDLDGVRRSCAKNRHLNIDSHGYVSHGVST